MGDYTSAIDIRKLYKKIDTAGLTDNDIDFYIAMAEAEINGYISTKYTIPISPAPALLRDISSELSLIKILDRFFTAETSSKNEWRDIRKKDVMSIIEKISKGDMLLITSSGTIISPRTDTTEIYSNTKDYTPIFGHGHYGDEIVDIDRIDDEDDARDD